MKKAFSSIIVHLFCKTQLSRSESRSWHCNHAIGLLMLMTSLFLTGCLELEQTFTFHKDGSLTVRMVYAVPLTHLAAMTAGQQTITQWQNPHAKTINWFLDKKAVTAFFNQPKDHLKLSYYNMFQRDGKQFVEIIVDAQKPIAACELGYFGNLIINRIDNTFNQFLMTFPQPETPLDTHDITRLRELCKGLDITITIVTPTTIAATNGTKINNRQATWHYTANSGDNDIFSLTEAPKASW